MLLIPAYAKINLCLAVRGRRDDGFHDIDSVAVIIDWHDLVGVALGRPGSPSVALRVTGTVDVAADETNLAQRAAEAVVNHRARSGDIRPGDTPSLTLWLHKRIPTEAGLGGGSADAAAVLQAAGTLLGGSHPAVDADALGAIAVDLGSDVPMLLAGGAQRMRGRGEALTPIHASPLHLVVVVAGSSSTARTYAATRAEDHEGTERIDAVEAALAAGRRPPDDLLGSALEAAARRAGSHLEERLSSLRAALPERRWHLTGSGGAAFALTDDAAEATELAASARAMGMPARACRTVVGSPPR